MLWKWNVQNTEPTVPSTEKNNFLFENIVVQYNQKQVRINIYNTGAPEHYQLRKN